MRERLAQEIASGQGWYWPLNSQEAHYYLADGQSVCGKWFVLAIPPGASDPFPTVPPSDDCASCSRRVKEAQSVLQAQRAREILKGGQ